MDLNVTLTTGIQLLWSDMHEDIISWTAAKNDAWNQNKNHRLVFNSVSPGQLIPLIFQLN
jgi:hypothetical protein